MTILLYLDENMINLNIFGRKVYKERVEGFRYTASVFDLLQQWKDNFPVVDTAADILLLVIVGVHTIPLVIINREIEPGTVAGWYTVAFVMSFLDGFKSSTDTAKEVATVADILNLILFSSCRLSDRKEQVHCLLVV